MGRRCVSSRQRPVISIRQRCLGCIHAANAPSSKQTTRSRVVPAVTTPSRAVPWRRDPGRARRVTAKCGVGLRRDRREQHQADGRGTIPANGLLTARPRGSWRSPSQPCGQRLATRGVVVSRLIERSDSRQLNLVGAQPPLRARHDVIIRSTHQGGDRARRQHRFDRCAVVASHRRERGRGVRRRPPRGGARRSGPPRPDRHPWHRPPSLPPRR